MTNNSCYDEAVWVDSVFITKISVSDFFQSQFFKPCIIIWTFSIIKKILVCYDWVGLFWFCWMILCLNTINKFSVYFDFIELYWFCWVDLTSIILHPQNFMKYQLIIAGPPGLLWSTKTPVPRQTSSFPSRLNIFMAGGHARLRQNSQVVFADLLGISARMLSMIKRKDLSFFRIGFDIDDAYLAAVVFVAPNVLPIDKAKEVAEEMKRCLVRWVISLCSIPYFLSNCFRLVLSPWLLLISFFSFNRLKLFQSLYFVLIL